jgi:hypothetical protein
VGGYSSQTPPCNTCSIMRPCCQGGSSPDALLLLLTLLLLRWAACGLPQWTAVRGGCCEPVKGRALLQPARCCNDACIVFGDVRSDLSGNWNRGQGVWMDGDL